MNQPAAGEFQCHICGEPSQTLCRWCTKDTCANHICGECARCSDCCECDQRKVSSSEEGARQ